MTTTWRPVYLARRDVSKAERVVDPPYDAIINPTMFIPMGQLIYD
jgi:hypothetical protein